MRREGGRRSFVTGTVWRTNATVKNLQTNRQFGAEGSRPRPLPTPAANGWAGDVPEGGRRWSSPGWIHKNRLAMEQSKSWHRRATTRAHAVKTTLSNRRHRHRLRRHLDDA